MEWLWFSPILLKTVEVLNYIVLISKKDFFPYFEALYTNSEALHDYSSAQSLVGNRHRVLEVVVVCTRVHSQLEK